MSDDNQSNGGRPDPNRSAGGGIPMGAPFGIPIVVSPTWFLIAAFITYYFGQQISDDAFGNWRYAIGFGFAVVSLSISVIAFPLLLDRDIGVAAAVATSIKTVWENPAAMALWGFIVAAALAIGSLPLFIGLAIVVPILGHATWRLYRIAIERDPAHEHPTEWSPIGKSPEDRVAPHSFLFPWPKG